MQGLQYANVLSENELVYDEKRRQVVSSRDMTAFQQQLYVKGQFKRLRPDLTERDFCVWKQKLRLGDVYLNMVKQHLVNEVIRSSILTSTYGRRRHLQNFEDTYYKISAPHIKGPKYHQPRNWSDATRFVNYMNKISRRISKYWLHYPLTDPRRISGEKITLKEAEDRLKDRFVREIFKTPTSTGESEEQTQRLNVYAYSKL
eukprot:TRINITY_DN3264_c0_g1_i2.p1 TRINITY_DN3264_c0_g1~~TRINITY_DN3264_c0_g1_i2.p1  ORF type:complete len:202 (+),score=46.19 TRINITY_DN3264_c0_g1_i2:111-716(+)